VWEFINILFLRFTIPYQAILGTFLPKFSVVYFTESVADFLHSKFYLWRISLNGVVNVDEHQEEGHQHCHPKDARKDDI
jgi:hypothetical protein